ncbi:MAG: cysteine desulfurase family protein [Alphaproteobacteria bacterium]|nr:cysteine desulfurase family protein [Alphaproteobacteria bacterium]
MKRSSPLYLDYNATAPLKPSVQKFLSQWGGGFGNPSAVHSVGSAIRREIEETREFIAQQLGIEARRIIFTSGATESNNIILKGYKGPVIISAVEHSSVSMVREDAQICSVQQTGLLDLNHIEDLLKKSASKPLISVIAAHNETGVIQPMQDIQTLTRRYGALLHTDATQALGRLDFTYGDMDFISFSGHKIGALSGVGVMVVQPDIPILPLMLGGGQERSYRPGTPNVLGILSLKPALTDALQDDWEPIKALRNYIDDRIQQICPEIIIFGKGVPRLANTTQLTMPHVPSATQVMRFDLSNICLSAGSACSSGKVKTSPSLTAMGYGQDTANCALRLSLCPETTQQDVDAFLAIWQEIYMNCSTKKEML